MSTPDLWPADSFRTDQLFDCFKEMAEGIYQEILASVKANLGTGKSWTNPPAARESRLREFTLLPARLRDLFFR